MLKTAEPLSARAAQALLKRGLTLEYLTLLWNVVGTVVVLITALQARSIALAGFGLDSLIEIVASLVVIWQLTGIGQQRERPALKVIGVAFYLLAGYILLQTAYALWIGNRPGTSTGGLLWLLATLIAMLLLAAGKHATGRHLGNVVLMTEARVTLVDALLAGAVLVGTSLNALFGWWWADPLAGLVIVYYAVREGKHAWHESLSAE